MAISARMVSQRQLTGQLLVVKSSFCASLGSNLDDPKVWIGQTICNYLSGLLLELTELKGDEVLQDAAELRRGSLGAITWVRKRPATAEDILEALGQVIDVPADLAELIRKDIASLQCFHEEPLVAS